jgi:methionine aminotransferase
LKALTKLLKGTNIVVLSDEVYQHITFDGKPHLSLASVPELRERTLIVGSFGKSLHATGWKIGYVLAPEYLSKHFRSFHQWVVFAVNTPIQYAIAEYIQNEQRYLGVSSFLQKKRDYFVSLMEPTKFKAIPSHGTYFQLMDYTAISNLGDVEFSQWLTKEHRVATIPVSVFYHEKTDHKVVRFCFAKDDAELEKAAELLKLL